MVISSKQYNEKDDEPENNIYLILDEVTGRTGLIGPSFFFPSLPLFSDPKEFVVSPRTARFGAKDVVLAFDLKMPLFS